ncbi:MAG TPA: putative lipid II flippase FtsW [Thermodesulfobacteriota bacterium]|nr:putative lipid II flippase FtsW [Thermodesulfobacteriota bacterium]
MIKTRDTDRLIIVSSLVLVALGVLMVYSTSYIVAMKRFGDEYFFVKKHLTYAIAGIVLFIAATRLKYKVYGKLAYPALALAAVLLVLIYVPGFGFEAGGARRWVRLGPVAFQPSEPAKLAVIVFLAYSLSEKADRIKSFSFGFLPNILIPGAIIVMILLEPDLGTALTLALLVLIMNFAGGVRLRYLAGLGVAALPLLFVVVHKFGYMMARIKVFLDPWKEPQGAGFQMVQSFLAFGSGGVSGVGLGEGKQKLFYLPEAHTDFILSVIGEELGLIGVGSVIALYVIFLVCGVRIAMRARDLHGTYLALGLTLMVTLQAAVNMAVVMGLLPPKGLTLPFISYGGTSLVINLLAVGILLNIYIVENESA